MRARIELGCSEVGRGRRYGSNTDKSLEITEPCFLVIIMSLGLVGFSNPIITLQRVTAIALTSTFVSAFLSHSLSLSLFSLYGSPSKHLSGSVYHFPSLSLSCVYQIYNVFSSSPCNFFLFFLVLFTTFSSPPHTYCLFWSSFGISSVLPCIVP